MTHSVPKPVTLAAEARARGASWPAAAEEAKWELAGLRLWVRDHPREWARTLGRARRDNRDAACDEAVAVLRRQLRSDTDKTAFQAAAALAGRFGQARRRAAPADKAEADDPVQAYYDGLTDDERQDLAAALDEDERIEETG